MENDQNRQDAKARAGEHFDGGDCCTLAVLKATLGSLSPELQAAASGFHSGIGKNGCLCGAVTVGVMALGIKGCGNQSGELVKAFKDIFGTTCCSGLSRGLEWMSEEHQANCRRVTIATAGMVQGLLDAQQG